MRLALAVLLIAVAVAAVVLVARPHRPGSLAWRAVDRDLAARFPDVPATTTGALADALAGDAPPLVLDARTPAEYAVSHLAGAVRVDPDASPEALAAAVGDAQAVVVYCSVGVRSADVTRRLRASGVDAVNLQGSIFRWADEGRPLVRDGRAVREVHPYDGLWGRLLAPDRRADLSHLGPEADGGD